MSGLSLAAGSKVHAFADRGHDLYETPAEATRALLRAERVPHRVWEPACGPGAIVRVLRDSGHDVLGSDLIQYDSRHQDIAGLDFLISGGSADCLGKDRAIVTNPPYKHAHQFVRLALKRAPYVAMLLRLAFLESERRRDILDNSSLARVHVFRDRLPMMHRANWDGPKASNATAFAWFVWDRSHQGPAQLNRISWRQL